MKKFTPLNHVSRKGGMKCHSVLGEKNFGALHAPFLPMTQISLPLEAFLDPHLPSVFISLSPPSHSFSLPPSFFLSFSLSPFTFLFLSLLISRSFCIYLYISILPSIYLFIYLSNYLSIHLSLYLSIHLSIYLS